MACECVDMHTHTTQKSSNRSDKGLTLKTALKLYDSQFPFSTQVAKPKLSCYYSPLTQRHSFFRNLPPLFSMLISRSVSLTPALSVSLSVSHKVIKATNSQAIVNRTSKFKSLIILSWFLPLLLATIKRSLKLRIFFVIPCNIELQNLVFRFSLLAQT